MIILFTTSFTMRCAEPPEYLATGEYFEDLIAERFDLEIEKHSEYPNEHVYVFTITYPAYQAREFAWRMQNFCNILQQAFV